MSKIDVHQHLWTEPLAEALAERGELPFVRRDSGLTVLFLAGERPHVIDLAAEAPGRRAALVELDGLDQALLCLSSRRSPTSIGATGHTGRFPSPIESRRLAWRRAVAAISGAYGVQPLASHAHRGHGFDFRRRQRRGASTRTLIVLGS
jgi:hypothetical protein